MISTDDLVDIDRARQCGLDDVRVAVLVHLARGHTYRQTGSALRLSESAVGTHVRRMLSLAKARNQTELVALAFDAGVLRTAVEREWRARMGVAS